MELIVSITFGIGASLTAAWLISFVFVSTCPHIDLYDEAHIRVALTMIIVGISYDVENYAEQYDDLFDTFLRCLGVGVTHKRNDYRTLV